MYTKYILFYVLCMGLRTGRSYLSLDH